MIEFLAIQVRLGRITIEQVPERFRAEVEAILNDYMAEPTAKD